MPRFRIVHFKSDAIADGCYVAKIISAEEKTSDSGNAMLVMKLRLPDDRELPCVLTFVEKAEVVINAFCDSAQLIKPPNGEAEISASDCVNRYLYVSVANETKDPHSDPIPHVTRFLTREQALIKNPQLAHVQLQEQKPLLLKTAY